ncbi:MAG: TatD family hydrolase [Bacteroidaceae bacterium]|nr:TatD family hydrolase [Bacteroidaceae bacterium]
MELLDIHTHNTEHDYRTAILNCKRYSAERNISTGIHPWDITDEWEQTFAVIRQTARHENVKAIGECGIDKLKSAAPLTLQQEVFKAHAMLAEEVRKPLIIHCVKGFDEIIAIHKKTLPQQAWIIHGFRGKPQQTEQLLKAGFYISFGEKFNMESLKAMPLERLFVESDESNIGIYEIYSIIAQTKGCSMEELAIAVRKNAANCNIIL